MGTTAIWRPAQCCTAKASGRTTGSTFGRQRDSPHERPGHSSGLAANSLTERFRVAETSKEHSKWLARKKAR